MKATDRDDLSAVRGITTAIVISVGISVAAYVVVAVAASWLKKMFL